MSETSAFRRLTRRAGAAVTAGAMLVLGFATVTVAPPPAAAAPEVLKGAAKYVGSYEPGETHPEVPNCGSVNIDGRKESAWWTVTSDLGPGSIVYPGRTWTVTAEIFSKTHSNVTYLGNNGPDPLRVSVPPTGPVKAGAPPTGELSTYFMKGDGWAGPQIASGDFGYEFDASSSPGGLTTSDQVSLKVTTTYEATAPGTIHLAEMKVSGHDGESGNFSCAMDVAYSGWSWTVVAPEQPTSGPDVVHVDSRYAGATPGDANNGQHAVAINVLANDDDPNVVGGPGDTGQVRIKSWDSKSVKGGGVACGTTQSPAVFNQMSTGPCYYESFPGVEGSDSFSYVVRSVSGLERKVTVSINLRPNHAPYASDSEFGAMINENKSFPLSPFDLENDVILCEILNPPAGGNAVIQQGCGIGWDPDPMFTGTAKVDVRLCDTHATLQNGQLGQNVKPVDGFYSNLNLSPTASRRCRIVPIKITVSPGLIIPPVGVADSGLIDASYPSDGVGPYSILLPVLNNDFDNNGPQPADPTSGVKLEILDPPHPLQGTVTVTPDRRIRFTTQNASFSGVTEFTYRICENPAKQGQPYIDDPDTEFVDEGLPFCGVGKVAVQIIGNRVPVAENDEVSTNSGDAIMDFDVSANDSEPDDEELTCKAGNLAVEPGGLLTSATIDGDCLVDLVPAAGKAGEATMPYTVCDDHHLLVNPSFPANPYGADGRVPGALAPRCRTAQLTVKVVAPYEPGPSQWDIDPAPVCAPDELSTPAGVPVDVSVLANDSDLNPKGNPSPITLAGAGWAKEEGITAQGGTVESHDDGTVTYTPPVGFSGTDEFVYTAVDSIGKGCEGTVTIKVLGAEPGDPGVDPDIDPQGDGPTGGDTPGGGGENPGNTPGDTPGDTPGGGGENPGNTPGDGPTGGGNPGNTPGGTPPGLPTGKDREDHVVLYPAGDPDGTSQGEGGTLPRTGLEILAQVTAGLALVGGGGALRAVARRRRTNG